MTPPSMPNLSVLEHRVSVVEGAVDRIADAVQEIAKSTSMIAALEARHAETRDGLERAFTEISKLETSDEKKGERITAIEIEMPGLREMRKLIVTGVVGIIGIVGAAVIGLVILR